MSAPEGSARQPSAGLPTSDTARTEAFSDGVFAIAITLLVLEVHIPDAERIRGAGGLLPALLQLWPGFLSYLASFVTIGVICSTITPPSRRSPQSTGRCRGQTSCCC